MNLLLNVLYSIILFFLFKFPMRELAELNGASLHIIIFISGVMSYITTKTIQYMQDNHQDMTFNEFFYIF